MDEELTIMDSQDMEEEPVIHTQGTRATQANSAKPVTMTKTKKTCVTWVSDPTITQLSSTLLQNLKAEQGKLQEAGEEPDEATQYKEPTDQVEVEERNRIRLSIKRARQSDTNVPTLKVFKSFVHALKACDKTLAIFPINMNKQNLSAITTSAQISSLDINKLQTYFKTYFPNQKNSLSGYIHISTQLCTEDLLIATPLYEWLETNRYSIKPCISADEEMVQIGALCFGSEYVFRNDLAQAIQDHPAWKFPHMDNPPVILLTRGDFRSPKKSIKMIFVQTEKSKQLEVGKFFSSLYDGTPKNYPNGIMLLFIPLYDHIKHEPAYRQKVIYNHERYLGEEEAFCIHGLQDFNTTITLKDNQKVTLRMLLRSLPATQGMSRPQLFQMVETDSTREIILVTYQKCDKHYVSARKMTLEIDIKAQLAPGEVSNVFISEMEGLWFTPVTKTKHGQIIASQLTSRSNIEYLQHTNSILSSPPKKRPFERERTHNNTTQTQQTTYAEIATGQYPQNLRPVQPQPINLQYTQTSTNPNHLDISDEISRRFQAVKNDLKQQQKWNAEQAHWNDEMIYRINYLEDTTTSTDTKVDTILNKLNSWDMPIKQRGSTNNEERNAPYPPFHSPSGARQP